MRIKQSFWIRNDIIGYMGIKPEESDIEQLIKLDSGIYPMFEAFYIESILYSATCADQAFGRFDEYKKDASKATEVVASAHEALTHVAAISRFFWPSYSKQNLHYNLSKKRGEKLRKGFNIRNDSALSDRNLRNAIEHFDEKLDAFLLQGNVGYFHPEPIVDKVESVESDLVHVFRFVDPEKEKCILLGQEYSFTSIRGEISHVLNGIERMKNNGWTLAEE